MSMGIRIPENLYPRIPDAAWITGRRLTAVGDIPVVPTQLTYADIIGSWKARWGINRMHFTVVPGLYCTGNPDESSPVFVTANYKMSFDHLRKALDGIDAWIMVLDTRGINVWCAAGKGTFATGELVKRIALTGLSQVVSHRTVILPQLGATGVAAHEVRKQSGFKVVFGPVRAEDILAFMKADMKATRAMRQVRFDCRDRIILTPVELTGLLKPILIITLVLLIARLTGVVGVNWADIYPYIGAVLVGTVLTPILLPWIPGRPFALKGWLLGMLWAITAIYLGGYWGRPNGWLLSASLILILPAISAYLALQFTGASTYTSFSGVKKETKAVIPAVIASISSGLLIWIIALFI